MQTLRFPRQCSARARAGRATGRCSRTPKCGGDCLRTVRDWLCGHGRRGVRPNLHLERRRSPETRRIAPDLATDRIHTLLQFRQVIHAVVERLEPEVPVVGEACREAQHARTRPARADQDRRAVWSRSAGNEHAVVGPGICPPEIGTAGPQQLGDDRHRLLKTVDPVIEREAEGRVLRLVPTGAEPKDQTTAADLVDGISHLGKVGRVAEAGAEDERPDFGAVCHCGEGGNQRPAFPRATLHIVVPLDEVIGYPDRVETDRFGRLGHCAQVGPAGGCSVHLALGLGQEQADLEWTPGMLRHSVLLRVCDRTWQSCAVSASSYWSAVH